MADDARLGMRPLDLRPGEYHAVFIVNPAIASCDSADSSSIQPPRVPLFTSLKSFGDNLAHLYRCFRTPSCQWCKRLSSLSRYFFITVPAVVFFH
jgi:hypothetical protein